MTRNEQLALVIQLACVTEDRDDAEQKALVAWAWTCDVEHNKNTTGNRYRERDDFVLQDLVTLVQETRVIEPEKRQRVIPNPNRWENRWTVWLEGR